MVNSTLSLEDLKADEKAAVIEFKKRMIGLLDENMFEDVSLYVRFLRARDLNIDAAEAMLKNHIEWRKKLQVDTILTNYTPREVVQKYFTINQIGVDKDGSPILFFNFGNLDSRGILKSCRKTDVIKFVVKVLESTKAVLKKESFKRMCHIDKWIMFINFEGFSFGIATHKETLEVAKNLITMYEANYPERLKVAFFVNASVYFTMAFAVVKHLLSERTYKKIRIVGREGWQEEAFKLMGREVLPAFIGGTRTGPNNDPFCSDIITIGGQVPETYFLNKKANSLANTPGVKKMIVTRMSKHHVALVVSEPGIHIEWEFETKNRDIGFSLLYKRDEIDGAFEVLIPKQRIDTNMSSETGMFKCDKLGIYIIEFDNTYSWIYRKEVYYKVSTVTNQL